MSISLFGSRSLSANIGGCYHHMLTRVITFLVLISSPVITILIFSQIIALFWVFSWVFSGSVRYFCFSVLPFGLSSAPYVFTKCLRPLVKFWRFNGVKIVVFLDDGYGKGDSFKLPSGVLFCPVIFKQCRVCSQFFQIAMGPYSVSCLVGS